MGSVVSGPGRGVWEIGPSKIHGRGVLCRRAILAGSLIGVGIGYRCGGLLPLITSDFGAWINHSDRPTASLLYLAGNWWVVANGAMEAGDEVTLDYRKTPWYVRGPEAHYV